MPHPDTPTRITRSHIGVGLTGAGFVIMMLTLAVSVPPTVSLAGLALFIGGIFVLMTRSGATSADADREPVIRRRNQP